LTTTSSSIDEQLAAAIATTDPVGRYRALETLRAQLTLRLERERGRAVRDLARKMGPRNFGPTRDRELNWEAAGRELGMSGDWAKRLAEDVVEPAAV
jgi:hypothetical protein